MWIRRSFLVLCFYMVNKMTSACYVPLQSKDVEAEPCGCTTEKTRAIEDTCTVSVPETQHKDVGENASDRKEVCGGDGRISEGLALLGDIDGITDGETVIKVTPQRKSTTRNWSMNSSRSESSYPPGAPPNSSSSGGTLTQTANGSTSLSLNSSRSNTGKVTTRHSQSHSGSSATGLQGPPNSEVVIRKSLRHVAGRSYINREPLRGNCIY